MRTRLWFGLVLLCSAAVAVVVLVIRGVHQLDDLLQVVSVVVSVVGILLPLDRRLARRTRVHPPLAPVMEALVELEQAQWPQSTVVAAFLPDGTDPAALLPMVDGPVVIIGAAGSGKSTVLVRLLREEAARRVTGGPVPVLLPAVDWDPLVESLDDAILQRFMRLSGDVARHVDRIAAAAWPTFVGVDGLDELSESQQAAALTQLADLASAGRRVVVTCRDREFDAVRSAVPGLVTSVIAVPPLTARIVADHLRSLEVSTEAPRWTAVSAHVLADQDGVLAQALTTPVMVQLLQDAYSDPDRSNATTELLAEGRFANASDVEAFLIERWLAVGSDARRDFGEAAEQRRWLAELAIVMERGTGRFLPWHLTVHSTARLPWLGLTRPAVLLLVMVLLLVWATTEDKLGIQSAVAPPSHAGWQVVLAVLGVGGLGLALTGRSRRPSLRMLAWPTLVKAVLGLVSVVAAFLFGVALALLPVAGFSDLTDRAQQLNREPLVLTLGALCAATAALTCVARPARLDDDCWVVLGRDRTVSVLTAVLAGAVTTALLLVWTPAVGVAVAIIAGLLVFWGVHRDGTVWGQYRTSLRAMVRRGLLPPDAPRFIEDLVASGVLRRTRTGMVFERPGIGELLASESSMRSGQFAPGVMREVVSEVLAAPAAVSFVGPFDDGNRRRLVRARAEQALNDHRMWIRRAGEPVGRPYRTAHRRMIDKATHPWWTRHPVVYQMAAVLLTLLVVATTVLLLGLPFAAGISIGLVIAGSATNLACWPWRGQPQIGRLQLVASWVAALALGLTALVAGVDVYVADALLLPTAAVSLCLAAVAFVAWDVAAPIARDRAALESDDPADWARSHWVLPRYREVAEQARRRWIMALARDGVLPLIRTEIQADHTLDTGTLPQLGLSRLGGVQRPDQLVDSTVSRQLDLLLGGLDSGSIAISGPRGAGKSTLLRRYCTGELRASADDLVTLVQAPTSYDRREFLVHLFTEVCLAVTARQRTDDASQPAAVRRNRRILIGVLIGSVLVFSGAWAKTSMLQAGAFIRQDPTPLILVVSAVLAVGTAGRLLWLNMRHRYDRGRGNSVAEAEAARQLRALRFQSSTTHGDNGTVGAYGLGYARSRQIQRTEQTLTYPELVGQFRTLLAVVRGDREAFGPRGRVIIGVDELDKMASTEEAERFLNDLKVVFGIEGCFFLVAVSEEALSTFDRRTLGVRTALDSAFDAVIPVLPLTLAEATRLIELRGVRLPRRFLWLSHALSGGLPRDLLRVVLALASAAELRSVRDMPSLADVVIRDDLRRSLTAYLRHHPSDLLAPATRNWLAGIDAATVTTEQLWRHIAEAPNDQTAADVLTVRRAQVYLYQVSVLLVVFAATGRDLLGSVMPETAARAMDRLGYARAYLGSQTDDARRAVNETCQELGLPTPAVPQQRVPPRPNGRTRLQA